MINPDQAIALEVNGEAISLREAIRLAQWRRGRLDLIEDAVDDALIRQAAAQRGISVSDEELQQAADEFRLSRDLIEVKAIKSWLANNHLTLKEWEALLAGDLQRRKLRDALTEGAIEPYFAEHRLRLEAASISRIVLNDEEAARELRAQVVEEQADFHALARQYSLDQTTRLAGGYAGEVKRQELEAAIEAAVFGAEAGAIVGPLKTDDGWQLIKIEAHHPAVLDEAERERIRERLFQEWLSGQRRGARLRKPLLERTA